MRRFARSRHAHGSLVLAQGILVIGAALLGVASVGYAVGIRVNLSGSIPPGLYRAVDRPIVRGSLVLACLPPDVASLARIRAYVRHGSCADGTAPVGKQVVALPRDTVDVGETGVFVDGRFVPNSAPLRVDSHGRSLPVLRITRHLVAPNEIWLVSSYSTHSFDSRYFGGVPRRGVVSAIQPLFTGRWW